MSKKLNNEPTSAINAVNPTDEELAAAGLRQRPKNVWTMRE
ncbi:MAG: hypothetical protein ACI4TC_08870 [Kiritimatiellia bacterium]